MAAASKREPVEGYMCRIDWEYEIGNASGGTRVYASIEDLKRDHECADECGIVKVEVRFVEVIAEGKLP
jgi:hypothetical protein